MNEFCSIKNYTKSRTLINDLLFVSIKDKILGKKYELGVAYVGDTKIRNLNRIYRNKDYATDILSFPLSETSGDIFINPNILKKKAPDFNMTEKEYTLFLIIHGCLHLKGYDHGSEMEKLEKKFLKSFLQNI